MRIKAPKDLRVATTSGGVVVFKAGEVREVSDAIGAIAIGMGAEQLGGPIAAVEAVVETPEDSVDEVILAIEKLIQEGSPLDFKANGEPKAAAIHRELGKTVSSELRDQAWDRVFNG